MVVMNISRSRKARNMARPRPSADAVEKTGGEASAGPAIVAEEVVFVPMPPITPPPDHLRRELTPKLGSGVSKQLGSPPEKKGRMQ